MERQVADRDASECGGLVQRAIPLREELALSVELVSCACSIDCQDGCNVDTRVDEATEPRRACKRDLSPAAA